MSPSRKSDKPRRPRRAHGAGRHAVAPVAAAPPPSPLIEWVRIWPLLVGDWHWGPRLGAWATGSASAANEHTGSLVHRIGAIAWLARVALRGGERAA